MMAIVLLLTWTGPMTTASASLATASAANKQSQQQQQQQHQHQHQHRPPHQTNHGHRQAEEEDDEQQQRHRQRMERERKKVDRIMGTDLPPPDTKEGILAFREHRKRQLRNLVRGLRKELTDYAADSQNSDMTMEEKREKERLLDIYSRKLNTLEVDLDDMVSSFPFCCSHKSAYQ